MLCKVWAHQTSWSGDHSSFAHIDNPASCRWLAARQMSLAGWQAHSISWQKPSAALGIRYSRSGWKSGYTVRVAAGQEAEKSVDVMTPRPEPGSSIYVLFHCVVFIESPYLRPASNLLLQNDAQSCSITKGRSTLSLCPRSVAGSNTGWRSANNVLFASFLHISCIQDPCSSERNIPYNLDIFRTESTAIPLVLKDG